jgi:hypothetical protein
MTSKVFDSHYAIQQVLHSSTGTVSYNNQGGLGNTYSRVGADLPKYRYNVRHGQSAVNNLDAYRYERRLGGVKTLSAFVKPNSGVTQGQVIEISDSFPFFSNFYVLNWPDFSQAGVGLAEANNRASTAIFKAIRNAMYQISGPTFLGELRESLMMIRRPAESLQKGLGMYMLKVEKNLKGIYRRPPSTRRIRDAFGNWQPVGKNASRELDVKKMLADTWLEYSFGWSPLISDIKSAAIALARFNTDIRRERVSAVGVHENVTVDLHNQAGVSPVTMSTLWDRRETLLNRVSYKVGLSASLTAPQGTPDRLIELCGFSMQNFIPTVWELLPWSFLVDYFANVNNVLEAYTTDLASVTWVSKTEYTGAIRKLTARLDVPNTKATWGNQFVNAGRIDAGEFISEVSNTKRRSGGLTYPQLRFQLPDLPRQVGNMAALLLAQGRMRSNSFI